MLAILLYRLVQVRWWFLVILLACFLFVWVGISQRERMTRVSIGNRAPKIKECFPFEIIYRGIKASQSGHSIEFWKWLFCKFGTNESPYTVETKLGLRRYILTAEPEVVKAALATQFEDFEKGEHFNRRWRDFLGNSVFTTDGQIWHDKRRRIRQIMVKERMGDLEIFERHSQKLLNLIQGRGHETELQKLFFQYTLDVASEFLFGDSVGSLDDPQVEFAAALSEVQRVQVMLARSGPFFPLIPRRKFREGLKVIDSFTQRYIDRALGITQEELEKFSHQSFKEFTFLHALASTSRDPQEVRDEVVNILFAGRDTTAATLSWLFYELSNCPAAVHKIRSEIQSVMADDRLDRKPTHDELKRMKYLHNSVNEILRLYPPVPINIRFAARDTTIQLSKSTQPLLVHKGDAIAYSTLLLHRRSDIYPPVSESFPPPDQFSPERWEHWTPTPWTYIPFNGGPRICPGQQFALTEIYFTTVRILQRFRDLELVEDSRIGLDGDDRKQFVTSHIVATPGRPVRVRFWEEDL